MKCFEQSNTKTYANAKFIKKFYPKIPKDISEETKMAINLAEAESRFIGSTEFIREQDQIRLIKIINDWVESMDKGGYQN